MPIPNSAELITAVRGFLEREAVPALSGRQAYHARVAAHVLAIVERELAAPPEAVEREVLTQLIGGENPRAALVAALRTGAMDADTPGLIDALTRITLARMAADNPKYSTYRRLADILPHRSQAAVDGADLAGDEGAGAT